jgi:hypothetical protein
MIGNSAQFTSFRNLMRKQIASMTDPELKELDRRFELLRDDIVLRRHYLLSITPLAIIRGEQP